MAETVNREVTTLSANKKEEPDHQVRQELLLVRETAFPDSSELKRGRQTERRGIDRAMQEGYTLRAAFHEYAHSFESM